MINFTRLSCNWTKLESCCYMHIYDQFTMPTATALVRYSKSLLKCPRESVLDSWLVKFCLYTCKSEILLSALKASRKRSARHKQQEKKYVLRCTSRAKNTFSYAKASLKMNLFKKDLHLFVICRTNDSNSVPTAFIN